MMAAVIAASAFAAPHAADAAAPGSPSGTQPEAAMPDKGEKDLGAALAALRTRAAAGNADAQYDLGQAYRRGQGVAADEAQAQSWYRKAAEQGHVEAQAQLGLMLFTSPRRADSFAWLEKAAAQGEPRAQYVLGTALFNGDGVAKDWPRAYALMSRAAAGGLDPATRSLATMDAYLIPADRQAGLAMANAMAARETIPASLRSGAPVAATAPAPPRAKGGSAAPAVSMVSGWRVQLGAFGAEHAARAYWADISPTAPISALQPRYVPAKGLVRLQAGPFASKADASRACTAIQAAGRACFLVAP